MKNRITTFILLLLIVFAGLSVSSKVQDSSYVVIVNESNPVSSLSKDQTSRMFLKKVLKWGHGIKVEPVDQSKSSETRKLFTEEIHGKSVSSIKSYWQKMTFSGRSTAPPEKQDDFDVISWVKSRRGAIGYISSSSISDGVKIIAITK